MSRYPKKYFNISYLTNDFYRRMIRQKLIFGYGDNIQPRIEKQKERGSEYAVIGFDFKACGTG